MKMLVILLIIINYSIGCGDKAVNVRITSVPIPTPTPKLSYTLAKGSVFIATSEKTGINEASGLQVCLVNANNFGIRFEETKKVILCRYLCVNVYKIKNEIASLEVEAQKLNNSLLDAHKAIDFRRDEYKKIVETGNTVYSYVDPFNGTTYPGRGQGSSLVPMIKENLEKLEVITNNRKNAYNEKKYEIKEQDKKVENIIQNMMLIDSRLKDPEACYNLYATNATVIQEYGEVGLTYKSSQDVIDAIDENTMDKSYSSKDGAFSFKIKDNTIHYLCFATCNTKKKEVFTWIIPIEDDVEGYRDIVLSDKNCIDSQSWNESIRQLNLSTSLKSWLSNYKVRPARVL